MRFLRWASALLVLLVAYLTLWPVPIDPEPWHTQPPPEEAGPLGPNDGFAELQYVPLASGHGPEDVEVDEDGRVYLGLADGSIVRVEGERATTVGNTGGRPLGLAWMTDGRLAIADAYRGLVAMDAQGRTEVLVSEVDGAPVRFADDVDVGPDGVVYFSDASDRFQLSDWQLDVLEAGPRGRLCAYDPSTGRASTVLGGLHFANGVAVDPEGRFVLVNETSRTRVRKVWIAGERQGQEEILLDNLPAFPDGISAGTGGVFWLALAAPRTSAWEAMAPRPWLRRLIARLPAAIQPAPQPSARVLGIDAEGRLVHGLYDPAATHYGFVTSVQERGGRLYLGSIEADGWAHMPRPGR